MELSTEKSAVGARSWALMLAFGLLVNRPGGPELLATAGAASAAGCMLEDGACGRKLLLVPWAIPADKA